MRRLLNWILCHLGRRVWQPRVTKHGGKYQVCARCPLERIGGLLVDIEERRRGA